MKAEIWRCACGSEMRWTPGVGPGVHCACGRRYERPTVDVERLCERVDALEREVRELRAAVQRGDPRLEKC
jgi:hypothetical protein